MGDGFRHAEGVIQGKPEAQRVWLKPGDKIACSLEKLGELRFELTGPAWPERLYDRIQQTGEAAIRPRSGGVYSNRSGSYRQAENDE